MVLARKALPITLLFVAVGVLGVYCIYLNRLYYSNYGPFYDSLSYMNHLALIMGTARSDGLLSAIAVGVHDSTVFFPWLLGAVLGTFAIPAREHVVLVQLPLVLAQAVAGYLYFRRVLHYSALLSFSFSILLVSFEGLFFYNGGLSDFRMDLSQALAFGSALAFFFIARQSDDPRYGILSGVMLGVACLVRATTPVYALFMFGICAVFDLFSPPELRRRRMRTYLTVGGTAILLSLWFFLLNFENLHYYYFVWNFDATAGLPLSKSMGHVTLLLRHVGVPIYLLLGMVLIVEFYSRILAKRPVVTSINAFGLLGAIIPVGVLIFSGAALNPFVSMVAVPGFIMFGLAPFKPDAAIRYARLRDALYAGGALLVCAITAYHGISNNTNIASPWASRMAGIREVTIEIGLDMQWRERRAAVFEVTYVGSLDSAAIMNSFVFDEHFGLTQRGAEKDGMKITAISRGLANPAEWKKIKGDEPMDKVRTLVTDSIASTDYLIMPEPGTSFVPHHSISPYAMEFRQLLLKTGRLTQITGPIKVSANETVSIYRNNRP